MSFLDDLISVGSGAIKWLGGNSIGSSLAKAALTGFALNQITKSINRENTTGQTDQGTRLQVNPNTENKIPVIYGRAVTGGILTDAQLVNSNQTMYYCLALSEKTGTKFSDSQPSSYIFRDVYWNDERVTFKSDGYTVDYTVDNTGAVNNKVSGLIRIYFYAGNSETPQTIPAYSNSTPNAYTVMPGWTTNHMMEDLVFAIVSMDYNREKDVTSLGKLDFVIENSMTLPGDCLYDMMTNTRYGAGIDSTEIYQS